MYILGINDTHDSSACLIKDGKIVMALAEERITRTKNIASLPTNSIKHILDTFNLNGEDLDIVAVATKEAHHLNLLNIPADFTTQDWRKFHEEYYVPIIYDKKKIKIRDVFPKYKPSVKLGYSSKKIRFISNLECTALDHKKLYELRKNSIAKLLKVNESKIKFFDHHKCHALYGYYCNPKKLRNKKVIIVTADSGGDRVYNSVSTIENGKYNLILNDRNNIIGQIYQTATILLGMNPTRHPYKVMGLAPYASEYHKKHAREVFLDSLKLKKLKFIKNKNMKDHYHYFKERLKDIRFDGIAGGVQDFVEIRLVEWFKNLSKELKSENFVFSGGVANNVKANKVLIEQKFVKSLFIPPGPGDESLSIGACYAAIMEIFGTKFASKYIAPSKTAYWGDEINKRELKKFKSNKIIKNYFKSKKDINLQHTARALANGHIVFFFYGKMEFGQRALGHRSILSDPSKIEQVQKINDSIKKRDFWMPFTPSILSEDFNKYVINKKEIFSDFMTVCFDSTPLGKKHFKAAIHPYDYTIRPQRVSKLTCAKYYQLLRQFKKLTGIGGLLNTSLNIHDKPIIHKPTDILKEILKGDLNKVKYLYVEDTLYEKKNDFKKNKN